MIISPVEPFTPMYVPLSHIESNFARLLPTGFLRHITDSPNSNPASFDFFPLHRSKAVRPSRPTSYLFSIKEAC